MTTRTPTLVRVKRRITDDPSEILVLSAKRSRTSEAQDAGVNGGVRLLKLAGTVDNCEEQEIASIVQKKKLPNFEELKKQFKKSNVKTSTKSRAKAKELDREAQRFRVVNTKRSIQEGEENKENQDEENIITEQNSIYQLFDIFDEKENSKEIKSHAPERLSCNGVEMIREYVSPQNIDDDYVYDVYFAEQDAFGDFNDSLFDGLVSVQPFCFGDSEFMYDEYREAPEEFKYEDDEDSNDEDFRGNEYPDEDEFSSEEEYGDYSDHLDLGINRLRVTAAEPEDLSSDEEDELVYSRTFHQDAAMHGKSYAKYKADMLRQFQEDGLLDDSEKSESDD